MRIAFHKQTRQFQLFVEGPPDGTLLETIPKYYRRFDRTRGCVWVPELQADLIMKWPLTDQTRAALDHTRKPPSVPPYDVQRVYNGPTTLRPFQAQDVAQMVRGPFGAFHEMGLGKSVMALIAWECLRKKDVAKRLLIICTKRMIGEWEAMFEEHLGRKPKANELMVFNYAKTWREPYASRMRNFVRASPTVVVIDEIHNIRHESSKQYQAIDILCRDSVMPWGLSGTPVPNKPESAFSAYKLITGAEVTFEQFYRKFTVEVMGRIIRYKNLDVLQKLYSTFSVRRTKKDVAKELPPPAVHEIMVPMEGRQRELYRQMRDEFVVELEGMDDRTFKIKAPQILVWMGRLMQIASHPSMLGDESEEVTQKLLVLDELLTEAETSKVILWSRHPAMLEHLNNRYWERNPAIMHGKQGDSKNERNKEKFLRDKSCRLLCISIKAFGEGLNLQSASNIAIYHDLPWDFDKFAQSRDRIHRIGQAHKVQLYILCAKGSVEEYVYGMLKLKELYQDHILGDSSSLKAINQMNRREMLKMLKRG